MKSYEPIIGLEVHVELNTKSKMFCRCSADYFGKKPNTHTCPVCLGLPGALPFMNEKAIESCIKIGLALNCKVSEDSLFERKNYFYPDLDKGFQISQYRWPLNVNGWLEVENDKGEKTKIRINRVHQEEDTAKLVHQFGISNNQFPISNEKLTGIDFNRSGVPLVEIVTEPDFTDSSQIRDYAKKLQQIFRYLGVSNADMEKGDMRLEANVSVRKIKNQNAKVKTTNQNSKFEDKELPPYRVELKNINSFRFMVAAVEYEIKRQIEALEKGEKLRQETRGWDENKRQTFLQRSKEEANDYRYFPEPDLPELKISADSVKQIAADLPELPVQKAERYVKEFGLTVKTANVLVADQLVAQLFDGVVNLALESFDSAQDKGVIKEIANYIVNQKPNPVKVTPDEIVQAVKSKKSGIIEDEEELEKIAQEVISENEASVTAYKKGKENAIQSLIGGVMRKTSGKANAKTARAVIERILKNG